jgi:hypothetical protein
MKINNLKNILKQRWVFYWSGNWPMLDALYENNPAYARQFKKISGTTIRARADFCHRNTLTVYHTQEEYDRLEDFFLKKFTSDPAFLVRSARDYRQRVNKDLAALRVMYQARGFFSKLTGQELARKFLQARSHFVYNAAIDAYDWLMEKTALGQRKVRGVAVAADDTSRFDGVLCKPDDRRLVHVFHCSEFCKSHVLLLLFSDGV